MIKGILSKVKNELLKCPLINPHILGYMGTHVGIGWSKNTLELELNVPQGPYN